MPGFKKFRLRANDYWLWSLLGLVFLSLSLALILSRFPQVQIWWKQATGRNAKLIIPVQHTLSGIKPYRQGISQGLEGDEHLLLPIIPLGRDLKLQLVRIDHVLDAYDLVTLIEGGGIQYNFQKLDDLVQTILKMNARPMFALSYMPPTLSADGSVEGPPADWQTWQLIIQKFIEHYSGIENYNIENVYYEVWNEPDLFGQWKPDRDERNYLTLYRQTALAAAKVNNVNHFYLGGPATTAMYPNWIKALIAHAQDQKLKLDFISWHRYGTDVDQYYRDFQWVNDYLRQQQLGLQTIISEWGYSSELNPAYDNQISAAHTAAVIAQLAGHVDWLLPFELVDGLDPAGKQYWGRWGVLTNPQTDLATKPRYRAMQMLAELPSQRLRVLGQGSWVNAIAATDPDQAIYQVLITNYDSQAEHTETVPVDFLGLPAGRYQWQLTYLNGDQQTGTDSIVGPWRRVVFMKPNEVALLAVKRIPDSQ